MKNANMVKLGQDVEGHLLGLKEVAREEKFEESALFSDKGYRQSKYFLISTIQVKIDADAFMSYGPAFPEGYGICYNPGPTGIFFSISSSKSGQTTSASKMGEAIKRALRELRLLLENVQ